MYRYCYIVLSLVAIVIAAVTVSVFGIADGFKTVAAMTVACAFPYLLARRCSWWTPACSVALMGSMLVLVACAVNHIWESTLRCNLMLDNPVLGPDATKYFRWALHHYDGRCEEPLITFCGFPLAILGLWRVLGVSMIWPVALNVMLTVTSIILGGRITVAFTRKIEGVTPSAAAAIAMALLGVHCFFISQGHAVQKEASMYVAMSMIALVFVELQQVPATRRKALQWVCVYAAGCLLLAVIRAKYINFAALGIVLLAVGTWRKQWRSLAALSGITVATWMLGMYCSTTYSVEQQVYNVTGGEYMDLAFGKVEGIQEQYLEMMGGYFGLPMWKRVLLLPFTSGVQYVIPFPWGAEKVLWGSIMPRLRLGWYVCGGLAIVYYAMLSWRRKHSLGAVLWWPVICFAGISFISGGTVSRYILPLQPTFCAIAVYVGALIYTGTHRKQLLAASGIYALLLVVALATAAAVMS